MCKSDAGASRGVQGKAASLGMQEDLGDEHHIDSQLERLSRGQLLSGVQAFRSQALCPGSPLEQQLHRDGRSVQKSTKNLQLKVLGYAHSMQCCTCMWCSSPHISALTVA